MRRLLPLAALLLAGCAGIAIPGLGLWWPGGGPATVSLAPGAWTCRYASPCQISAATGGFTLPFPAEIDYLTTNVSINAKVAARATVKIETSPGATFSASDGCTPASFRIMLEARNDDGRNVDKRWWARLQGPALSAGTFTFNVSLSDLSQWSNVQGTVATVRPVNFQQAISELGAVGLTFGACAFGHGVSVNNGTAKLTVTEFSVL